MDNKMRLKIIKQLRNDIVSIQKLSKIVKFRTNKRLQTFVDTVNEMSYRDEIMPITIEEEKCLMLIKK